MRGLKEIERLFDEVLARLVEIRGELDVELAVAAGRDVEDMDVATELIDDASAPEARAANAELGLVRQLARVAALGRHRPQIIAPVAVRDEIEPVAPRHGPPVA